MHLPKRTLCAALAVLCAGLLCAFAPLPSDEAAAAEFEAKKEVVDWNDPYKELEALEPVFQDKEIFLSGENHAIAMNFTMQKYMLRYFVERQDARYLLMENSYAQGELLNRYLENGDEQLLRTMVEAFEQTFAYNQGTYELFRFLHDYYQSLPQDKRFRIVGLDIEHQPDLAALYMGMLLTDKTPAPKIAPMIEKLRDGASFWSEAFHQELWASLTANKDAYRAYFGDNYFSFTMLARNLTTSRKDMSARESAIIENFKTMYSRLPKGKYFGQFGGTHLLRTPITVEQDGPELDALAGYLDQKYEPTKGKVFCIQYIYSNCQYRDKDGSTGYTGAFGLDGLQGGPKAVFLNRQKAPALFDYLGEHAVGHERLGDSLYFLCNSPAAPDYRPAVADNATAPNL